MKEKTNFSDNFSVKADEIDLLEISKSLVEKRKSIFLTVGIFSLMGIFISFLQTPSQFQSETTFLLKSGGSGNGTESLGGLAAIAGVDLPSSELSSGSEISPSLYPKFISSIEFKKALLNAPISIEGESENVTYAYYYENMVKPSRSELIKSYTIGLPSKLISMINPTVSISSVKKENTNLLRLSANEIAHFARLDNQLNIGSKDGVMVLSFSMPEPLAAAQMADFAFHLLQKEIINYKLGNLREELRFSESLFEEKKREFEKIQNEVGFYKDRNQNVVSSSVQNQMERLQSEYSLKLNIFTQVASSLEATKLQIARDTPIFSVLDPVTIPNGREGNNGGLIILLSTFLGVVVALIYTFAGQFLSGVKEKWSQV